MSVIGTMGSVSGVGTQGVAGPIAVSPPRASGFGALLEGMLTSANAESQAADRASTELVVSQGGNLHETMIALERADLSVRFTLGVAQRLVQSYNELSRMQV